MSSIIGDSTEVYLAGASCRAAAESARRTLGPSARIVASDLFGDRDLHSVCDEVRVLAAADYPRAIAEVCPSEGFETQVWMYCGGLENHPQIVEDVSARWRLCGCDARILKGVRDPVRLAECLQRSGLPFADVYLHDGRHMSDSDRRVDQSTERWLVKPLRSCGGVGIRRATGCPAELKFEPESYLQRFVDGPSHSGVFVGNGQSARFLGATVLQTLADQLADRVTEAPIVLRHPFLYAGSLGPIELPSAESASWQRLGAALATEFGLVGLFGVDAVVDVDGAVIPIEVNPRFTASMELIEKAMGASLVGLHLNACLADQLPDETTLRPMPGGSEMFAKEILYAKEQFALTDLALKQFIEEQREAHPLATFHDLPVVGTGGSGEGASNFIEPGRPVMTAIYPATLDV